MNPNPKNPRPPTPIDMKKAKRVAFEGMGMAAFCEKMGFSQKVYYRARKQFPEFRKLCEIIVMKHKGKKPWVPPLNEIKKLAARGLNKGQIAATLGIHIGTYMAHQAKNPEVDKAFEAGQDKGVADIKSVLFTMAKDGKNLPATLAFLKRHDHETQEMPTKIVTEVIYTDQSATGVIHDED